jgi:hypothetical protein
MQVIADRTAIIRQFGTRDLRSQPGSNKSFSGPLTKARLASSILNDDASQTKHRTI